jgi:hypothetical protein
MSKRTVMVSVLSVVLLCSWASFAAAQQNQPQQKKKYTATRAIVVDSQSGAVRMPSAQETQELVDRLVSLTNRSTEGLQVTTLPNGTRAVNLENRFQSVMLARPNPDGSSEIRCVTTFAEAADFLGLVEDKSQQ